MRIKIPKFIWIMIQTVVNMFTRQESIESRHKRLVATVVRETHDSLVLFLKLYLWEEKAGVPHPHTVEEISKVFRVRLQDIQAILGILRIRYQAIEDLEEELTKV
jgi:hypothetical protein